VVGSVDNVLRAFVVGAREKQYPMLIALAAIGGTYAFGPLGILLGPLVVSPVAALLKEIQKLVSPQYSPSNIPQGTKGRGLPPGQHLGK
jgi:predicted PurR-regulated permease PerM